MLSHPTHDRLVALGLADWYRDGTLAEYVAFPSRETLINGPMV